MAHDNAFDSCLVWLHRTEAERPCVGGKAASLSRLATLGAPVPPAFALTTRVYQEFAASVSLPARASDVADADLPCVRAMIEATPLPPAIVALLQAGLDEFGWGTDAAPALAVRSSATAEDSADFSFAGLHDTVLDVRDLAGLERAVKQCWASLWSDRAVVYRRAGGLAADQAAIAVVVQALVASDVSFVVFTVDPVNGNDDHLVIAATWGLGEAVVSGLVVPDHIVLDADGTVLEYAIGDKHLMVIPGGAEGQGAREVPVPRALRSVPVLTTRQCAEIGAIARDLSRRLGFKADIEGAIEAGCLYILQARPITTLKPSMRRS